MRGIQKIRYHNPQLADKIQYEQHGFLLDTQVDELQEIDRLMLVLVRCGCGRFMCPIQDVRHFTNIIEEHSTLKAEKEGKEEVFCGDYIRDVSLPA